MQFQIKYTASISAVIVNCMLLQLYTIAQQQALAFNATLHIATSVTPQKRCSVYGTCSGIRV
jgi:hypothetical protein